MHIDFNFYDASFQVTRILPCMLMFLVADTQLYKRLCPSVHPSVGRSVGWSVGRSVGRSVTLELKTR